MGSTTIRIKDGSVEIPNELRERYGIEDGSLLVAEAGALGILLRPASLPEPEVFTIERQAEFLLNNAVSETDYQGAIEEVRRLGLDPETILHNRPPR